MKPVLNDANNRQARLRGLDILVTVDSANCSHIAAPKILRTEKFIRAMAHAPMILSTEFVKDSLDRNEKLNPRSYILKDREGEKNYDLKLSEVGKRAKANKGRLLGSQSIYCTEDIAGGFDTYKSIITANGGRCLLYRARAGSITSAKAGGLESADDEEELEDPEYVYLISGTTPGEVKLWPKFRSMVQGIGRIPRIVKSAWMLDLALRQEIRWTDEYELTDEDITTG